MINYTLMKEDISTLKHMVYSLYEVDLEKSKVAEIVLVGQAIDSLNQSIERMEALREVIE